MTESSPPAAQVSPTGAIHPMHQEQHFTASASVRDVIIGMADGLTVPFALAAGMTGAVANLPHPTTLIVIAGLAEIAAGSIAMGLGGFLAARSDAEHYVSERQREEREIVKVPEIEAAEVSEVFRDYGLDEQQIAPIIGTFRKNPKQWVDFMMKFELGLDEPDPRRALKSALTIAGSYICGGILPLAPYMVMAVPQTALLVSVGVTLVALLVFGYLKGRLTGTRPFRSAMQTALIGGLASAAAFFLARAFSTEHGG
ncbi:MAG TPA: VIT1/CCC1 transporter family protein [Tepidisphaeraceae bacterium]